MTSPGPRIALIHATPLAVEPIQAAFQRHWPAAVRMNLLDDSLSADRAAAGRLTQQMVDRFLALTRYAVATGCEGILFTCSAFGPAIEAAARLAGRPTLKPNEAMFEQALALTPRTGTLKAGLLATFEASLPSMSHELQAMAAARGAIVDLHSVFVPDAMRDLAQGRAAEHHRKVAESAQALQDCDVVMLAQFSMASAREEVQRQLPCPVLASPDCAVLALHERILHA
ncbi:aspartate/glutamate racemase family protein [Ramlibacter sp. MMS24-I3-19]|uniref:aspartate/glutamate racemase family protein n=1 Tax=Ramlibacter sp. MMS24-I3-19 TaxID=3416606 RepID=UPI003D07423F